MPHGTTPPQRAFRRLRLGVLLSLLNRLDAIAQLYGDTDKVEHQYLPRYRRHFGRIRFKRNTIFEIGVGGNDSRSPSGSLPIWRDYFCRSRIVGIDLFPKDVATFGRRVLFQQADQGDRGQLQAVIDRYGTPDVVIDDGSHVGQHVVGTFELFWPQLRPGGVYVVEDMSTSYWPDFGGADPAPATSAVGLVRRLADSTQTRDVTHGWGWGPRPSVDFEGVESVHTYPGIAFIHKAGGPIPVVEAPRRT